VNGDTRVAGQNAAQYVRNSILHPNEVIAPGVPGMETFPASLMPQDYAQVLSDEDLENLVTYLFTLHD
jgi:hypothetical protein